MIDIDGKYSYSAIVSVSPLRSTTRLSVFPNPLKGEQLFLKISEPVKSVNVKILDASGRIYKVFTTTAANANGIISLKVGELPNGTYIIKADTDKNVYTRQVVIQH